VNLARLAVACVAGAFAFQPVAARSVEEILAQPPQLTLSSNKPFYEIERCIVLRTSPTMIPYRTPDRPYDSLFLSHDIGGTILWTLTQTPKGLAELRLYSGGRQLNGQVRDCLSKQ
jgi:hypothetical protein